MWARAWWEKGDREGYRSEVNRADWPGGPLVMLKSLFLTSSERHLGAFERERCSVWLTVMKSPWAVSARGLGMKPVTRPQKCQCSWTGVCTSYSGFIVLFNPGCMLKSRLKRNNNRRFWSLARAENHWSEGDLTFTISSACLVSCEVAFVAAPFHGWGHWVSQWERGLFKITSWAEVRVPLSTCKPYAPPLTPPFIPESNQPVGQRRMLTTAKEQAWWKLGDEEGAHGWGVEYGVIPVWWCLGRWFGWHGI